jgi:hypothetical protein
MARVAPLGRINGGSQNHSSTGVTLDAPLSLVRLHASWCRGHGPGRWLRSSGASTGSDHRSNRGSQANDASGHDVARGGGLAGCVTCCFASRLAGCQTRGVSLARRGGLNCAVAQRRSRRGSGRGQPEGRVPG